MRFSRQLDFTTVNTGTIQIQDSAGTTAIGSFSPRLVDTDGNGIPDTEDLHVVIWQPACPTQGDYSDAGLSAMGGQYTLRIRGSDSGGATLLRTLDGRSLKLSETRTFHTPNSTNPAVLFEDQVPGAPRVVVRRLGSSVQDGVSQVEVGAQADPNQHLYFERDLDSATSRVVPGPAAGTDARVPLNLYSDESQSVVFVVEVDQPINPSLANLTASRVRLEYRVPGSLNPWTAIETRVDVVQNCSATGAQLRLSPVGILPASSQVRAVLGAGFEGLVGLADSTLQDQAAFAVVDTRPAFQAGLVNPGLVADEIFESFDVGGATDQSLEDVDAELGVPIALWGGGKLSSNLNFPGDGGEGGNFDWVVSQPLELFDTSMQTIIGGPNQSRSLEQFTVGGVANVHDFIIRAGAELRIAGPNPFVVNATGEIRIEGVLRIDGGNARDVATLNTGSQPEPGGSGIAGGGDGGSASSIRSNSTPRGDFGFGPFGSGPIGGQGGESGAGVRAAPVAPENRRPGGGGGGRFAADMDDTTAASEAGELEPSPGMVPTKGGNGHEASRGAVTGMSPALGGTPGLGAFADARADNDFLGLRVDLDVTIPMDGMPPVASAPRGIIVGELNNVLAGFGGGGGGDALPAPSFPTPNWTVSSDEKGGGGGGGAGAVRLRALGPIRFVGFGSLISCQGGRGATGENSLFLDRIGGSGGSGSGGHVILESAAAIRFELPPVAQRPASMRRHNFIDARGRAGRVGLPTNQAPLSKDLINIPTDVSFGGAGGPGVIQLHVPDAITPPQEDAQVTDIVLPVGTEDELNAGDANALLEVMRPAGVQLLSNFAGSSAAQSRWIDLRRTEVDAGGGQDLVQFLFRGIDPVRGNVRTTGGVVDELAPLLVGSLAPASAQISGSSTLLLSGVALQPFLSGAGRISNDIYLRTPVLLRNFILRMSFATGRDLDFVVQDAFFDELAGRLSLVVGQSAGISLDAFASQTAPAGYKLIPRFFSIRSGGVANSLPDNSELRIRFEGTRADVNGNPDASNPLVPLTSDLSDFDALAPGDLDFIRFRVDMNLDLPGTGIGLDTPNLEVEFFRLPFVF